MSTQYNSIQAPYDYMRNKTIAHIEHDNVQTILTPLLKPAKVLELACGSGFYTHDLLKWGADSVLGVDISSAMMEEARKHPSAAANIDSGKLRFMLADCSKPKAYEGGPFDVIFGAWLLNYAPDRAGLVNMFRNVAVNLREGGHFVSVTIPPAENPIDSLNAETNYRPPPEGSGGLYYEYIKDVEEGIFFHCHGHTPIGDVSFDNYHLKKSVYEEAAREAGLKGEWSWGCTSVPERYWTGEYPGGASMEELETYKTVPNYGLLVASK